MAAERLLPKFKEPTPNIRNNVLGNTEVVLKSGCQAVIKDLADEKAGLRIRQVSCTEPCYVGRIFAAREGYSSDSVIQDMLDRRCQTGDRTRVRDYLEKIPKIVSRVKRDVEITVKAFKEGREDIIPLDPRQFYMHTKYMAERHSHAKKEKKKAKKKK